MIVFCILFIIINFVYNAEENGVSKLGEGDIGFIIECHVYRNLSGGSCSTPGEFEGRWFFTTYGNVMRDLGSISAQHIPESNYELTWKNTEENLDHYFSCRAIGLHGTCHAGSDDFEYCSQSYSGQISNCWNENQVSCRRLRFRTCPAGFYFKGQIKEICSHCESHYFSPSMNTDLNCTYCPYPTEGVSCNCPAGTFVSPQGCMKCPPGEFQNLPGQTSCKNCSTISPYAYSDGSGATECKTCKHPVSGGGSDCMQCEPGYEWAQGDTCTPCNVGEYQPTESDGPCLKCSDKGDHYYQDQKAQSYCQECAHMAEAGGTECMTCSPGKEWEEGDTCQPCPIGTYNSDTTDKPCQNCADAGPYFYTNSTGQSQCLTCPYRVWEGRMCAPPCPHQATPFRGSTDAHPCICDTVPSPSSLTVTSAYTDEDDICSIAVRENIIDKDKGGPVTFYNGAIQYKFGTDEYTQVDSVTLDGEGPHKHPVTATTTSFSSKKIEEYVVHQERKIDHLKQENEDLRTTIRKKEEYYYELESMVDFIASSGSSDWNGKLTEEKYEKMKKSGLIDKILAAKKKNKQGQGQVMNDELNGMFVPADIENVPNAGDYDPRDLYPSCPWKELPKLAQGVCGSCYCYSAVASITYRRCIQSQQQFTDILGMQDVLSCGTGFNCGGGFATQVFQHLETMGTVTESCEKYTAGRRGEVKSCPSTCDDGSSKKYYFVEKGSVKTGLSATTAMANMQSQGPIVCKLPVYEDMLVYNDGVYVHKTGSHLFDHEIVCLGYGTDQESGLDYWLCENSWGPDFGMGSYWKIQRGKYFSSMSQASPDFTR